MEEKNIALEILEKELKTKQEELKTIQDKRFAELQVVKKDLLKKYTNFFESRIPDIVGNSFIIELSGRDGDSIVFKAPRPEASYDKEVFTIYLKKFKYNQNHVDKVCLNYYTTWGEDDFEFTRLTVMGKVAEIFLDDSNKQALLDIFNNKLKASTTHSEVWKVERGVNDIKDKIETCKREAKWYKFETEGIKLNKPQHIEYAVDRTIFNCIEIKLLKYTNKNQKTATIEFITELNGGKLPNKTFVIDKVRIKNLMYYINTFKDEDIC
jgi:hypothetical protein